MSNRIDLSADTHIETVDGVRYLVTSNHVVTSSWLAICNDDVEITVSGAWFHGVDVRVTDGFLWYWNGSHEEMRIADAARIPLTVVAPVYEYREGERWSAIGEFDGRECIYLDSGCLEAIEPDDAVLRDRAAAICDGAEQFRALHRELKEARDVAVDL